jgi:hypothetical protein
LPAQTATPTEHCHCLTQRGLLSQQTAATNLLHQQAVFFLLTQPLRLLRLQFTLVQITKYLAPVVLLLFPQELQKYLSFFMLLAEGAGVADLTLGVLLALLVLRA